MTATGDDLNSFFRSINLSKYQKEKLDNDIKISEVIEAIQSSNKRTALQQTFNVYTS